MYWKVIESEQADSAKDKLQAYSWKPFKRPVQYQPKLDGMLEERVQAAEERSDPINFRVENRAQFVEGIDTYFLPEAVRKIFERYKDGLVEQNEGKNSIEYQMHCDPALVNDMFSVMVAHAEDGEQADEFGVKYKHLVVDYYTVYKPQDFPDGRIKYSIVLQDIEQLMLNFRPTVVTSDQFNSAYITETLSSFAARNNIRCNVYEETATGAKNSKMYENLKFSINNELVHSYEDTMNKKESWRCMLQAMLENVQFVNGKVVKPRSQEFGHLDLVDCLAVLNMRLLGDQSSFRREQLVNSSFIDNNSILQDRIQSAKLDNYMNASPMSSMMRGW